MGAMDQDKFGYHIQHALGMNLRLKNAATMAGDIIRAVTMKMCPFDVQEVN